MNPLFADILKRIQGFSARQISTRERYIFYTLIITLFFFLFFNLILDPGVEKWKELKRKILSQEIKLKKSLQILSKRKQIEEEYAKFISKDPNKPSQENLTSVLTKIETLATAQGVKITNIKPHPLKDMGSYKICKVEISAESKIKELVRFIYELESPPSSLRVEKLRVGMKNQRMKVLSEYLTIGGIIFSEE